MKNPFRRLKKVVTAPATAVRNTARLLRMRARANDVLELADQAAETPDLYRSATWWSRVIPAVSALIAVLPIPKETLQMLTSLLANSKTTITGVAMIVAAVAAVANGTPFTDNTVIVGVLGGFGLILGKDFNVTGGSKPQSPEAERRVP
jgi:hypothetical protein